MLLSGSDLIYDTIELDVHTLGQYLKTETFIFGLDRIGLSVKIIEQS